MKLTNIILLSFVILSNVNRDKRIEVDIIVWKPYIWHVSISFAPKLFIY
jgi:hypothetical protein